ncbi:MAG: hypothetical protein JST18_00855 [Bacteroidetes bacterium]|nr:hypothetical protein [Bacteroidota bacterium]
MKLRYALAAYTMGAFLILSCFAFFLYESYAKPEPHVVLYSSEIVPILSKNCTGCHSGATPSGNLDFTNYDAVYITVISHTLIDTAGNLPSCCRQAKLDKTVNQKFARWISEGALYN